MEMNLSSQRFRFNHLNIICFAFSVSFLAVFFLPSYAEAHIFPWWQRSCCWVFFFDFGAPKGLHRFFFWKKDMDDDFILSGIWLFLHLYHKRTLFQLERTFFWCRNNFQILYLSISISISWRKHPWKSQYFTWLFGSKVIQCHSHFDQMI